MTTASGPGPSPRSRPGVIASLIDLRRALVPRQRSTSFRGYIEQKKLWGIYEGEVIEVSGASGAVSPTFAHQPDHHVDVADACMPSGGSGTPSTRMASAGNVDAARPPPRRRSGCGWRCWCRNSALGAVDGDLAQQPGPLELMQRVVDGRQRHVLAHRRPPPRAGSRPSRAGRHLRTAASPAPRADGSDAGPPAAAAAKRASPVISVSSMPDCPSCCQR